MTPLEALAYLRKQAQKSLLAHMEILDLCTTPGIRRHRRNRLQFTSIGSSDGDFDGGREEHVKALAAIRGLIRTESALLVEDQDTEDEAGGIPDAEGFGLNMMKRLEVIMDKQMKGPSTQPGKVTLTEALDQLNVARQCGMDENHLADLRAQVVSLIPVSAKPEVPGPGLAQAGALLPPPNDLTSTSDLTE